MAQASLNLTMVMENTPQNSSVNGLRGAALQKIGSNPILAFMAQARQSQSQKRKAGSKQNGLFLVTPGKRRRRGASVSKKDKEIELGEKDSSSDESDYADEISEEDLKIEVPDDNVEYESELDELEIIEQQLYKSKKKHKSEKKKKKRRSNSSSEESSESEEVFEVEESDEELERRYSKKPNAGITAAQLVSGEKVVVSDDESDSGKEEDKKQKKKQEEEKKKKKKEKLPCIISDDVDLDDPHFLVVFHRFCDEALTVEESRTRFMEQLKTYCTYPGTVAHAKFLEDYRGQVYNGRRLTKNSECDLLFTVLFNNTTRLLAKYASYRRRNRTEMNTPPDESLYLDLFTDDEEETSDEPEELSVEEEEEEECPPEELTWKQILGKARSPATSKNSLDDAIEHVYNWGIGALPQDQINYKLVSTWKRLVRTLQRKHQDPTDQAQLNILNQPDRLRNALPHYKHLVSPDSFYSIVSRLHRLAHPYNTLPEQL